MLILLIKAFSWKNIPPLCPLQANSSYLLCRAFLPEMRILKRILRNDGNKNKRPLPFTEADYWEKPVSQFAAFTLYVKTSEKWKANQSPMVLPASRVLSVSTLGLLHQPWVLPRLCAFRTFPDSPWDNHLNAWLWHLTVRSIPCLAHHVRAQNLTMKASFLAACAPRDCSPKANYSALDCKISASQLSVRSLSQHATPSRSWTWQDLVQDVSLLKFREKKKTELLTLSSCPRMKATFAIWKRQTVLKLHKGCGD